MLPPIWLRSPPVLDAPRDLDVREVAVRLPATSGDFRRERLWQLSSKSLYFGGYSAMVLFRDNRLRLFSDRGTMLTLDRVRDRIGPPRRGRLMAHVWDIGPFSDAIRDIESATRDPATGTYWLGFENVNAIARYDSASSFQAARQPPELADWPVNAGAEAMTRLPDGRFLVLPEHRGPGLLFASDPTAETASIRFRFDLPAPYAATELAVLPDGKVLVLARGLRASLPPFTARLYLGDPARIATGEAWPLDQVAELDRLVPSENWEAMAVEAAANGDVLVWLATDDNRAAFQRTLLARLRWRRPAPARESAARP